MPTIAEDLYLLMLDPRTGAPSKPWKELELGLGGAVLLELVMLERVTVAPMRRGKPVVVVTDPRPPGELVLDEGLRRVGERPRPPDKVVPHLAKDLRLQVERDLQRHELLSMTAVRTLLVFRSQQRRIADTAYTDAVRDRVRGVLLAGAEPDHRTAALVALLSSLDAAHVAVRVGLDRRQRKEVRERAKAIAQGAWAADAVRAAVQAVQAATTAAVTAAIVASTASTSSSSS